MKQRRLIMRASILFVIAAALGYTFYSNFFADHSVAKAGNDSVNFVLHDLEGERLELDELKGKGVFLNFWGTYCRPCEKEMPVMENLYQEYKEKGVEIVAVNVSEPELTVERFVSRYKLSFPVAIDKGMKVSDAYGINPLPTTILIDEQGTIVHVHQGGMTDKMVREFMEKIVPAS
ncbi:thiol-disulfide oxidoreductase ResA [Halalkalibacter urbisdiaboli]|uniref:thiol-disulfide oxidoreductase ResA n=1 Tax=Halalkalibacter urbisdiaboli TaxID=1960589 RepID=UPI000B43A91C|nr:thiol-disulfide oxidoreductase ResA [Halalkalibacter urbisdiaboli]